MSIVANELFQLWEMKYFRSDPAYSSRNIVQEQEQVKEQVSRQMESGLPSLQWLPNLSHLNEGDK